jgi:hypothetical protein
MPYDMEIKIKNTTDKTKRAVVFGFNNDRIKQIKEPFFDINTDSGVEIIYDGNDGKDVLVIEKMRSVDIDVKNIEFTSNKNKTTEHFYFLYIDANGKMVFDRFIYTSYLTPIQESVYPIIIHSEYGPKIERINYSSSLLFFLEPNEEIYLKINEKQELS